MRRKRRAAAAKGAASVDFSTLNGGFLASTAGAMVRVCLRRSSKRRASGTLPNIFRLQTGSAVQNGPGGTGYYKDD